MEPALSPQSEPTKRGSESKSRRAIEWRPIVFAVLAVALVMAYAWFHKDLSLHGLAEREDALRQYQQVHPLLLPLVVFAIFVAGTGVSVPYTSVLLSLGCGWLFGVREGIVLASFAVTAGDTIAFWISRYLLRDSISHHFDDLMKSVDELTARDGAFYLLSLRLLHVVPAWLINLLMGWTTIRSWTFWWATQLGTLPATIFYVVIGAQLKSLHNLVEEGGRSSLLTPGHVALFVVLAILPLIARQVIKGLRGEGRGARKAGERGQGPGVREEKTAEKKAGENSSQNRRPDLS